MNRLAKVVFACCMIAGVSMAGEKCGTGRGARGCDGFDTAALIEKYDTDGDKKLDAAELTVMKDACKTKFKQRCGGFMKRYDTDGDGKLSDEERAAMKSKHKARREKMMEKYDADGDGALSKEERAEMKKEWLKGCREKKEKPAGDVTEVL